MIRVVRTDDLNLIESRLFSVGHGGRTKRSDDEAQPTGTIAVRTPFSCEESPRKKAIRVGAPDAVAGPKWGDQRVYLEPRAG